MSKIKPETGHVYFSAHFNYTNTMCDKTAHIRSVTEDAIYNYHLSRGVGNSDIMKFPFTVRTVCCCQYEGSSCSLL